MEMKKAIKTVEVTLLVLALIFGIVGTITARQANDKNTRLIAENAQRQRDDAAKAKQTQIAAHNSCIRSQTFGPDLVHHLSSFEGTPHALKQSSLDYYNSTIPKKGTCPPLPAKEKTKK